MPHVPPQTTDVFAILASTRFVLYKGSFPSLKEISFSGKTWQKIIRLDLVRKQKTRYLKFT